MAISISKLRGVSAELAADLKARGIVYSDQLLDAARTPAGRKALAGQVGVVSRVILELANRADLTRVRGVAGVFSDLLEHAGVDTVKELATRNPDNLHAKLVEINAAEKLAGRTPPLSAVKDWVAQAQALPKLLEY
jgi:predicted flap endonuclease-1-like 5' DNA nuclease